MQYLKTQELAVLAVTKRAGWNTRGTSSGKISGYYWFRRWLRFEKLKIELRTSLIECLNDGLRRVGTKLGFSNQILVSGLPTLADIASAENELQNGLARDGFSTAACGLEFVVRGGADGRGDHQWQGVRGERLRFDDLAGLIDADSNLYGFRLGEQRLQDVWKTQRRRLFDFRRIVLDCRTGLLGGRRWICRCLCCLRIRRLRARR